MKRMVLGFCFSDDKKSVVLIRKNRPVWQEGRFNGVGGKVEEGESDLDAMIREFREETGVETFAFDWRPFCSFGGLGTHGQFHIECYVCICEEYFREAHTTTDEEIHRVSLNTVYQEGFPALNKLQWMVALALDENTTSVVRYDSRGM